MVFLPNETIIATPFQGVCLTNLRVRSEGRQSLTSIMLDQLSYVRATWHTNPGLLLIAFVAALVGMGVKVSSDRTGGYSSDMIGTAWLVGSLLIAVVFVAIYFASRYSLVTIASSGGTIRIQTNAKFDKCTEFIEKVEAAKHARTDVLFSL